MLQLQHLNKSPHPLSHAICNHGLASIKRARQHDRGLLYSVKTEVVSHIESSSTESLRSREATREEVRCLRLEAEQYELKLREELNILRQGLENCIKETAKSTLQANKVERGRLADITNAIYRLWAEKKTVLESIMVSRFTVSLDAFPAQFSSRHI